MLSFGRLSAPKDAATILHGNNDLGIDYRLNSFRQWFTLTAPAAGMRGHPS